MFVHCMFQQYLTYGGLFSSIFYDLIVIPQFVNLIFQDHAKPGVWGLLPQKIIFCFRQLPWNFPKVEAPEHLKLISSFEIFCAMRDGLQVLIFKKFLSNPLLLNWDLAQSQAKQNFSNPRFYFLLRTLAFLGP